MKNIIIVNKYLNQAPVIGEISNERILPIAQEKPQIIATYKH